MRDILTGIARISDCGDADQNRDFRSADLQKNADFYPPLINPRFSVNPRF